MRRSRGFTIMEILISITILLVGIVGVISLFPVAIRIGGDAIADSLSANLARSVAESIRAGMKHRKVAYTSGDDMRFVLAYFIYDHDGIFDPAGKKVEKDPIPADPLEVKQVGARGWERDCVILLPCDNSQQAEPSLGYGGETAVDARRRAYLAGKVFVYPEGDPGESKNGAPENGYGDPSRADDDKDDFELDHGDPEVVRVRREQLVPDEEWPLRVTKTYRFGPRTIGEDVDARVRKVLEERDPYRQYSYAFAIRRAYEDANVSQSPRRFSPASDLFEVKVMVFRAFMPETRHTYPIFSTTFLVSR